MVCEFHPICDFLLGSLRMPLPTDMVDVELTVWMIKGIYIYRKDHTTESTVFTPWSKKVTPFTPGDTKFKHIRTNRETRKSYNGVLFSSSQAL